MKKNLLLILIFISVAYLSCLFHELGHWLLGEALGNDMTFGLNNVQPKNGQYLGENHYFYVLCGGPCFTILLCIISLLIVDIKKTIYAYAIIIFNFIVRLFPLLVNFEMQDEARISEILGVGKYTIAIAILTILLFITWKASHTLKLNYKDNLRFIAISICCIFLVLITDSFI